MSKLAEKKCEACDGESARLTGKALANLTKELRGGWRVAASKRLEKEFKFKDFRTALKFTNEIGELAEEQQHHPDIYLAWGKVKLTISTHSAKGLTENDFILAAKVNDL